MGFIFGIDFGTTNSALSVNENGKVTTVDIDLYNTTGKTLRSVLYFNEENRVFVGQEAIDQYINDGAYGRFMQSIKAFLPSKRFDCTNIYGRDYTIEELVAIILWKIKERGESCLKAKVDSVVIGRPVVFSTDSESDDLAQERLNEAALMAGFKNIKFQYEPVAAALTFKESLPQGEKRNILIGDFGGGTSDFTVIKLTGGKTEIKDSFEVLSLGGVYVGGDSFDSQIMLDKITKYFGRNVKYKFMGKDDWLNMPTHIIYTLCQWHLIPQLRERKTMEFIRQLKMNADKKKLVENLENLILDNYGFMLFQAIEKAKCELSFLDNSQIFFKERNLTISEEITREEFERINSQNIRKIDECVDSVVERSGIAKSQIDMVFITGGSSHIPRLQKLFIEKFGKEKIRQKDAFTSVVHGLGVSASFLF